MVTPVPVPPSPKSHVYAAIVPSGSEDPDASNAAADPVTVEVNAATGGWFAAVTVTCLDTEFVAPRLSVTVSFTKNVPATANVCDGFTTDDVPPSPKSHAYDDTVPSGSDDPDPSNAAARFTDDDVNDATGT